MDIFSEDDLESNKFLKELGIVAMMKEGANEFKNRMKTAKKSKLIDKEGYDYIKETLMNLKRFVKYKEDSFLWTVLEYCGEDKLDEREVYWISFYNSYNDGYNCTKGGQNGATRSCSLTWSQENEVIEAKYLGFSSKEIGEAYNIDRSTVSNIFKRHNLRMPIKRNLSYNSPREPINICWLSFNNFM